MEQARERRPRESEMKLRFKCPECPAQIETDWRPGDDDDLSCPTCSASIRLDISDALRERNVADRCPVCSGEELYYRKNFPQGLGALVIVVAGVASFYFMSQGLMILAWAFPLGALVIDMTLYFIVRFATCCYRCDSAMVGVERHESHTAFDLATAEKYS
jgi:hypothetical protein